MRVSSRLSIFKFSFSNRVALFSLIIHKTIIHCRLSTTKIVNLGWFNKRIIFTNTIGMLRIKCIANYIKIYWSKYVITRQYRIRYSSKVPETLNYITVSQLPELNNQKGQLVSTIPWPGKPNKNDYPVGENWYGDRPEPSLFFGNHQGATTVSKVMEVFYRIGHKDGYG